LLHEINSHPINTAAAPMLRHSQRFFAGAKGKLATASGSFVVARNDATGSAPFDMLDWLCALPFFALDLPACFLVGIAQLIV
jgi:hypothetical protein